MTTKPDAARVLDVTTAVTSGIQVITSRLPYTTSDRTARQLLPQIGRGIYISKGKPGGNGVGFRRNFRKFRNFLLPAAAKNQRTLILLGFSGFNIQRNS